MEAFAIKAFTTAIQEEIFRRLGVEEAQDLGGFENFVFDTGDTVIRISHNSHRTVEQLNAELAFVGALAEKGAPVCRPLSTRDGRWLTTVGEFHACRFERAAGQALSPEPYPDIVVRNWGRAVGQFHAISIDGLPTLNRPHWQDDANHDFVKRVPKEQTLVVERALTLMSTLSTLPDDRAVFGLIHSDAHAGNFFVQKSGAIQVFDFDDCLYAWFGYDLATILLGLLLQPWAGEDEQSRQESVTRFMATFLEGYTAHCPTENLLLEHMPLLIKLREFSLYGVIHAHQMSISSDSMAGRFMVGRKERLEMDLPFIDYDFCQLR